MKSISYFVLALALLAGCHNATVKKTDSKPAAQSANSPANMHTAVAKEVIQTSGYTYLLLSDNGKEFWAAVSRFEAEKGKTYYYKPDMEMENFKSKELNRVFDKIQFIMELSDQPLKEKKAGSLNNQRQTNDGEGRRPQN